MLHERVDSLIASIAPGGDDKRHRERLVLPLLQRVQREFGYIPREAFARLARATGVSESDIYGVATFYAQFKLTPTGKHVVTVCRGTACHVRRSASLLDDLRQELGIEPGETTPDLQFTLETVACFGSCALAPVVVLDGRVYGRVTSAQLRKMIRELAAPAAEESREMEAVR